MYFLIWKYFFEDFWANFQGLFRTWSPFFSKFEIEYWVNSWLSICEISLFNVVLERLDFSKFRLNLKDIALVNFRIGAALFALIDNSVEIKSFWMFFLLNYLCTWESDRGIARAVIFLFFRFFFGSTVTDWGHSLLKFIFERFDKI